MVGVKICGIRSMKDVEILNEYLPEYAGFVFAESRRRVTAAEAAELSCRLDPSVKKVGVFVNHPLEGMLMIYKKASLDVIQLHGDETPMQIARIRTHLPQNVEIWKAVRVKDAGSLAGLRGYGADRYVADAYVEGEYGGSGRSFNWALVSGSNMILAGGLNPENIEQALDLVRPFAVDVSSGVETDGSKDKEKIREFIRVARDWRQK